MSIEALSLASLSPSLSSTTLLRPGDFVPIDPYVITSFNTDGYATNAASGHGQGVQVELDLEEDRKPQAPLEVVTNSKRDQSAQQPDVNDHRGLFFKQRMYLNGFPSPKVGAPVQSAIHC